MNLFELKEMVFALLLDITQPDDSSESINVVQQAKINVTPAMAKNGVNVINNQTQTFIINKTVPKIIEMLKMIDAIEAGQVTLPIKYAEIPKQIENKTHDSKVIDISHSKNSDPIEACCAHFFKSRMEIRNAQSMIRKRYVEYVNNQFDSTAEAAESINTSHQNFVSIIDLKDKRKKAMEDRK